MSAFHSLGRHAEVLEHVLGYHSNEERQELDAAQPALEHFTITLARQPGAPATEVAYEVGRRLGWAVYDRELTRMIAEQLDLSAAVVEEIDEKPQSWLVECLEAFSSGCPLSEGRYFRCLLRTVRSLAERGSCVLVGRGAGFMLPPRSTLSVRLVASVDDRIAALRHQLHLDRTAAARKMEQIYRERRRFLRSHFLVEPDKDRSYDLVLNSSHWSVADCADFIIEALHHKAREQHAD